MHFNTPIPALSDHSNAADPAAVGLPTTGGLLGLRANSQQGAHASVRHCRLLPHQANAQIDVGQIMRVGVPHRSGGLAAHAFEADYPVMVSASAFWNRKQGRFAVPQATDLSECDLALDSAGFTSALLWKSKGQQAGMAGVYPWTLTQYLELVMEVRPRWYSQPDFCCEPAIANDQSQIDWRVGATAAMLEATLRQVFAWQEEIERESGARVAANAVSPPVPVIQGWTVSDYLRSLDLMLEVWQRWEPWAAPPTLVGLGSVCRRDIGHRTHGLMAILAALEGRLPPGSRLHLFGVKGSVLSEIKMCPWIASADSMAFDVGARIEAYRSGSSNTLAHRAEAMSSWMTRAHQRMAPAAGDQFRLAF